MWHVGGGEPTCHIAPLCNHSNSQNAAIQTVNNRQQLATWPPQGTLMANCEATGGSAAPAPAGRVGCRKDTDRCCMSEGGKKSWVISVWHRPSDSNMTVHSFQCSCSPRTRAEKLGKKTVVRHIASPESSSYNRSTVWLFFLNHLCFPEEQEVALRNATAATSFD